MDVLAFDYGLKQIGVATANTATGMAFALTTLRAKNGVPNWAELEALILERKAEHCLVGLPLNMDGSESQLSQRARKFARQIEGRMSGKQRILVSLVDERLSSFEAKTQAREQGHGGNYKRDPIDAIAAKVLLEQWLHQQG